MTKFTRIIIALAILASTDQGADPCLKRCANFHSGVCKGTNPYSPIHWTVNGQIVGEGKQTSPKTELSPRQFDGNGHWMQSLTARNVCDGPLIITCQEGEQQLLFYNISFCEDSEIETDSNTTTNTTTDPQPQAAKSYIAAVVLVPFVIIVAVAVILLLIWCMRRQGCPWLPVNVPRDGERQRRTHTLHVLASDDSGNLDDTNTPEADADCKTEPSETVPPEQKSGGVMTRIPHDVIRNQPKSNTSRDDTMIELKVVEANSMSMPTVKPQVDNVNQSPNLCLLHGPTTVQECSDKYVLDPVFYHDGQISVMTGIPSAEKATYCIPEKTKRNRLK